MKNIFTILLFLFLLSGCYSIQNYNNTQYTHTQYHSTPNETTEPVVKEDESVVITECPIYIPQVNTQTPDVPIEEIKTAMAKSDKEVIKLMTAHIRELRSYIADRKKQESILYEQYVAQCRHTLKR
jgi:PBP1b-binding outer membrane lipoprotein LpoB